MYVEMRDPGFSSITFSRNGLRSSVLLYLLLNNRHHQHQQYQHQHHQHQQNCPLLLAVTVIRRAMAAPGLIINPTCISPRLQAFLPLWMTSTLPTHHHWPPLLMRVHREEIKTIVPVNRTRPQWVAWV